MCTGRKTSFEMMNLMWRKVAALALLNSSASVDQREDEKRRLRTRSTEVKDNLLNGENSVPVMVFLLACSKYISTLRVAC